jgi:hypothetical protein
MVVRVLTLVLLGLALWPCRVGAQIGSESVGVNTHVPSDDVLDASVDLGVAWVRVDANWRDLHRGPGRFDFSEMERVARAARARGLRVFMTLAYTPDWVPRVERARSDSYAGNDEPARSVEWVAFVDAFVRRMRPLGVTHFGLWNEANLDGFWEEAAGLDAWVGKIALPGAEAVRAACSDCRVLGPELANVGDSDVALDVILSRTSDTWDIVTHHIYQDLEAGGGGDSFRNALLRRRSPISRASLRELLDLHGIEREVWISETGDRAIPVGDDAEEEAQRAYLTGVLGIQLSVGWWTNTFFYEIVDCGVEQPGCEIDGFGLSRPSRPSSSGPRSWPGDYRQKPAFGAVREMLDAQPALLGEGPARACGNGDDDDGDGRVDLADRGCLSQIDDSEMGEPERRALVALRNPSPVRVDGRLEEWSRDEAVTLGVGDWFASAIGAFGPVIASDLGAELLARWDTETLFLAIRVSDDQHVAREPNARLYLDDSVQIAFDPAATGGRGYDGDDEEWGCIAREGGTERFAGDGAGVVCATSRDERITSYEIAIPRAAIPERAFAAGARLRFSMLVNEDDGSATRDGTGREGWLELTRSVGAFKEPESFAEVVFEDRLAAVDADAGEAPEVDASVLADAGASGSPEPVSCVCRAVPRSRAPWMLLSAVWLAAMGRALRACLRRVRAARLARALSAREAPRRRPLAARPRARG